ncbi:MAG: HNH endonuclease [Pyrinomonadaceae bacterium]
MRNLVYERAHAACEYCRISEEVCFARHQIDHIIAEKHTGPTSEENLALACTIYNKNKGSDIASVDPETSEIVPLFNPRTDVWDDNFEIENGYITGLTPKARATVRLLQLNTRLRVQERKI